MVTTCSDRFDVFLLTIAITTKTNFNPPRHGNVLNWGAVILKDGALPFCLYF